MLILQAFFQGKEWESWLAPGLRPETRRGFAMLQGTFEGNKVVILQQL